VETLYAQPGAVGLAAVQVGQALRVLVLDDSARTTRDRLRVMVNPVLESASQWKYGREGCLSFPDWLVTVKRARRVAASWLTVEGEPRAAELRDFEAVIFQHELDHLDGILFIDRMRDPTRDFSLRSGPPAAPDTP